MNYSLEARLEQQRQISSHIHTYIKEEYRKHKNRGYMRKSSQKPEVKEKKLQYMQKYNHLPAVEKRKLEYSQRPEVKARQKARQKEKGTKQISSADLSSPRKKISYSNLIQDFLYSHLEGLSEEEFDKFTPENYLDEFAALVVGQELSAKSGPYTNVNLFDYEVARDLVSFLRIRGAFEGLFEAGG